jgi:3-oxoacyl-[acyl-carrier-protein] synthase-3
LATGVDDFDIIVPHQPSRVGMMAMSRYLPPEKTVQTLSKYGNCVSVSLPLTLDEAIRSGRLKRGHRCLMFGTGAGLSIAGMVFVF